jgi:hypothetical protein
MATLLRQALDSGAQPAMARLTEGDVAEQVREQTDSCQRLAGLVEWQHGTSGLIIASR